MPGNQSRTCECGSSDRDFRQQPDAYVAGAVGLGWNQCETSQVNLAGSGGVAQGLPKERSVRAHPRAHLCSPSRTRPDLTEKKTFCD